MKHDLLSYLLLIRPYTLPSIALVAVLARIASVQSIALDLNFALDIIFAFSVWGTMVYLNETLKTENGRPKIPFWVPIVFFAVAIIISLFRNFYAIPLILTALISTILYWLKSIKWIGSPFVFIFRGVTEIMIFASILLFYNVPLTDTIFTFAAIILLVTNSRNLVGDIRDLRFDKYTFPATFGETASRLVVMLFILIAIWLTSSLAVAFPLIVLILLILIIENGYDLHKIYVTTSIFYFLNLASSTLHSETLFLNLAYIGILLNQTYRMVPRKSNPK